MVGTGAGARCPRLGGGHRVEHSQQHRGTPSRTPTHGWQPAVTGCPVLRTTLPDPSRTDTIWMMTISSTLSWRKQDAPSVTCQPATALSPTSSLLSCTGVHDALNRPR